MSAPLTSSPGAEDGEAQNQNRRMLPRAHTRMHGAAISMQQVAEIQRETN